MPPRVRVSPTRISCGAGMTAGLEMWRCDGQLVLYDRSDDQRFAADVTTWNRGLNTSGKKKLKDAAQQDST